MRTMAHAMKRILQDEEEGRRDGSERRRQDAHCAHGWVPSHSSMLTPMDEFDVWSSKHETKAAKVLHITAISTVVNSQVHTL